jgi:transposase
MTITNCSVERLDHLGIVAGVIKDLKIIELIDEKLGIYKDESISVGETVAGMIINGLGFSNKPMSLTPLFFEHIPLELLFRAIASLFFAKDSFGFLPVNRRKITRRV